MTVASMPMVSPVGRDTPRDGDFHAADHVAAADHDGDFGAELLGGDQVGGDAVEGRLVDAEGAGCRRDTSPESLITTRR